MDNNYKSGVHQFGGLIRLWVPCLYERSACSECTRSIPLMESTGSHVMVDDTEHLKMFLIELPNIKLSYI